MEINEFNKKFAHYTFSHTRMTAVGVMVYSFDIKKWKVLHSVKIKYSLNLFELNFYSGRWMMLPVNFNLFYFLFLL